MRATMSLLFLLSSSFAGGLRAQEAAAAPHRYALISAVGDSFSVVSETPNVGSHMEFYRRRSVDASDNVLNRLVLRDLDQNIAAADPGSARLLLSVRTPDSARASPAEREQGAIDAVLAELKKHEQERRSWDRIIVVTPAYRAQDKNQMASRLQGMGVFVQPLCQTDWRACNNDRKAVSGPAAVTPDGKPVVANNFIAPYIYLTVWKLDPATLAVLSKTQVFNDQKISEPQQAPNRIDKRAIADRMVTLIGASIHDGLKRTDLTGHVEVVELKELPAAEAAK